jgi:hypothetical protein
MSGEKLFGAPVRTTSGNTDNEGLKLVLHRYIIDAIEESGKNLLEGSRQVLSQFVIDKIAEYIARLHLAISRYEMERLAEEIVDELTGFGPLEVLLRDPAVTEILVNGPHRVFIERDGALSTPITSNGSCNGSSRPSADGSMSRRRWSTHDCPTVAGSTRSFHRLRSMAPACRYVNFARTCSKART